MPNSTAPSRENFRLVYWGPSEAAKRVSLAGLSRSARDGEDVRLVRIPTSLDPSSHYEELSLARPPGARFTVVMIVLSVVMFALSLRKRPHGG